ncbi:MAG: hypothetical protein H0V07_14735 [Propionibacteriales bacterium]|nr:hypothetical protein [Propionibacteriales bacterium]
MRGAAAVVAGVAVVTGVGAVLVAGQSPDVLVSATAHPRVVAASTVTLSCPGWPLGRHTETDVVVAIPATGARTTRAARAHDRAVRIARLSPASQPLGRLTSRGDSLVTRLATPSGVVGAGSLAAGVTAVQWSRSTGDTGSGTAAAACRPPADDWWFDGVDTSVRSTSSLVLSNLSTAVAVVDLEFFGPHGTVQQATGRGVAVAARSSRALNLARFAPGLDALTVRVHAAQGRVVAAVQSLRQETTSPQGIESTPAGSAPATDVYVNAGFAGNTGQRLSITNPGSREALVQVQVIDANGQFVPTTLTDVRIPPGTVVVKEVGLVTRGAQAALHLTSTVPVTAASATVVRDGVDDVAVTSSSPPLTDPAVVPIVPGTAVSLAFVSGARTASTVSIDVVDDSGTSLSERDVPISGSALSTWVVPERIEAAYVVITADAAAHLHGVAHYRGKGGITALPILSGTYTVTRPVVSPAVAP